MDNLVHIVEGSFVRELPSFGFADIFFFQAEDGIRADLVTGGRVLFRSIQREAISREQADLIKCVVVRIGVR